MQASLNVAFGKHQKHQFRALVSEKIILLRAKAAASCCRFLLSFLYNHSSQSLMNSAAMLRFFLIQQNHLRLTPAKEDSNSVSLPIRIHHSLPSHTGCNSILLDAQQKTLASSRQSSLLPSSYSSLCKACWPRCHCHCGHSLHFEGFILSLSS